MKIISPDTLSKKDQDSIKAGTPLYMKKYRYGNNEPKDGLMSWNGKQFILSPIIRPRVIKHPRSRGKRKLSEEIRLEEV